MHLSLLRSSLILVFLLSTLYLFSQPPGSGSGGIVTISGSVKEPNGLPVPYASVLVYKSLDSSLVNGASTNDAGSFSIEIPRGNYYVQIRFIGYHDLFRSLGKVIENTEIKDLVLSPDEQVLGAVDVVTDRPVMELKLDKRVYNVQEDAGNTGQNAADILDNIPSVTVDAEGNVSLRGSGNVRLLIDGKPSTLTGLSTNDALRQIQGDMIERVEIITNPSARYDAEGEVGIINIVLKKKMEKGVNGSLHAKVGYPENFGGGFNLNARLEKVNLFGGYSAGYQRSPGSGFNNQRYNGPDTSYRYEQTSEHNRGGLSHNVNGGIDITTSKRSSLTLSALLSLSDGNNWSNIIYNDYDQADVLTNTVYRDEDESDFSRKQEYNLNFRKSFERPEQLFTVDVKKSYSVDGETSILHEYSDFSASSFLQRSLSDESEDSWLFQTDFIRPFGKEGRFETGAKVSLRILTNDYQLEDSMSTWVINPDFDNKLVYTENIYAAYIMAGNKWKKFSYQLGIRSEFSDITTKLVQTNEENARNYLRFFPSAHFSYELKKENFVQLSYSRRISRPQYWWLSPFFTFSDSRNFFSGNPNLDPEYTDSYEASYLKYTKKGSVMGSLYFRHTTDYMERILLTDSVGFTRRLPVNLGIKNSFGIEFSGSYQFFKWWNTSLNFNFYREISDGTYQGISYTNDTYAWSSKLNTRFTINRKLSAQTSFRYRSPQSTNQGSAKSQYNWDANVSMDLFKGNGTLAFNAKDILNSRKRRSVVESEYFYSESEFQWRSRTFTLSFTYRINQKKTKGEREDWGGDGDMDM